MKLPRHKKDPATESAARVSFFQRMSETNFFNKNAQHFFDQGTGKDNVSSTSPGLASAAITEDDRVAATPVADHDLTSDLFKGDPILEACFDGDQTKYLRSGSSGPAVFKLQEALIEAGYALPKFGTDSSFGNETGTAVSQFKKDNSLAPSDPIAGQKTIGKLDEMQSRKGKDNPPVPPDKTCTDSLVSQEKEPLPAIPMPMIRKMGAPELLELVKKRQTPGHPVPSNPPLGATIPTIENVQPAKARSIPIPGTDCFQCVAEWEMVRPIVEVFTATGNFSDEASRFFVARNGDMSGCPEGVSMKQVIKMILAEAEPKILDAELEHWSDFVFAYMLVAGRYLSNIRRLTPTRSHLRGRTELECSQKVSDFILNTTTRLPIIDPLLNFGMLLGSDLIDLYAPNTEKRDASDHSALSKPPKGKLPVFPNIDTDINPFGCKAYFRKFDKDLAPGVPGKSSVDIIVDTDGNIPPTQGWHTL